MNIQINVTYVYTCSLNYPFYIHNLSLFIPPLIKLIISHTFNFTDFKLINIQCFIALYIIIFPNNEPYKKAKTFSFNICLRQTEKKIFAYKKSCNRISININFCIKKIPTKKKLDWDSLYSYCSSIIFVYGDVLEYVQPYHVSHVSRTI